MAPPIDPDRLPEATARLEQDLAPETRRPAREKQRGPVTLRRDQAVEGSTTDQRLLDSRGPSDWVHTDPWRVLRIQSEFVEGFGLLAELPAAGGGFWAPRPPPGAPGDAPRERGGGAPAPPR